MKTLEQLENEISQLKHEILCQETGNESYYISPLYHQHLLKLEALEHEASVLKGKAAPLQINFDDLPENQRLILNDLAAEQGQWFAASYSSLSEADLHNLEEYKN